MYRDARLATDSVLTYRSSTCHFPPPRPPRLKSILSESTPPRQSVSLLTGYRCLLALKLTGRELHQPSAVHLSLNSIIHVFPSITRALATLSAADSGHFPTLFSLLSRQFGAATPLRNPVSLYLGGALSQATHVLTAHFSGLSTRYFLQPAQLSVTLVHPF